MCSLYEDGNSNSTHVVDCASVMKAPDSDSDDDGGRDRVNCIMKDILAKGLSQIYSCREDFPEHGRVVYSSVSMVIQYFLPTLTIAVAYYQICGQLKAGLISGRLLARDPHLDNVKRRHGYSWRTSRFFE